MGSSKGDVTRVRETLSTIIDLSDLSRREIERRLIRQGTGLDLDRLLAGKFELKLNQLLDVIRQLEVHPVEFFRLVFPEPEQRSPLIQKLRELFGMAQSPVAPRPQDGRPGDRDLEELRRRVDQLAQLVEQLRARSR